MPRHNDDIDFSQMEGFVGPIDRDGATSTTTRILNAAGALVPMSLPAKQQQAVYNRLMDQWGRWRPQRQLPGGQQRQLPRSTPSGSAAFHSRTAGAAGRTAGGMFNRLSAGARAGAVGIGTAAGVTLGELLTGDTLGGSFSRMRDAQRARDRATQNRMDTEQRVSQELAELEGAQQTGDPVIDALQGGQQEPANIEPAEFGGGETFGMHEMIESFMPSMEEVASEEERIGKGLENFGKTASTLGKLLEDPAAQKFLAQMGIAFAGGHPEEPGTILGQAAIQQIDADQEARVMQALLSGEDISDVDLQGLSSEAIRNISQTIQQQTQLEQADRRLDLEDRRLTTQEQQQQRRLEQFDAQIGIQSDRLELDWFKTLSALNQAEAPEGVDSWQHGYALQTVGSTFQRHVEEMMWADRERLGFSSIAQIRDALSDSDGRMDPNAIRAKLPPEIQQEFDRQVRELSKSVARNTRDIGTAGQEDDFTPGSFPILRSREEFEQLEPGSVFQEGANIWLKGEDNERVPLNDAAHEAWLRQQRSQGGQTEEGRSFWDIVTGRGR